jgi:hypothetical protein
MTRLPLLRIVPIYIKEYALAVISAALIYGGIYQVISALRVLIFPLAHTVPLFVDAIVHMDFHYIPSLLIYYSEARMWVFLTRTVGIAIIVIAVGILFGVGAESRGRRVSVRNS